MRIKVAQFIANFLVEHGVTHNFTVTGGGAMHLNDALGHKEGLTSIYNHHEQACAIAAEGYARLTGRIASVCVTSGPGGTNAITGVLGGWQDSIPMFVISGQVKRATTTWATEVPLRQLGDQEFQIVQSVQNMTKYAVMITEPESIRYHMEKAWYLANHGRKGPVWIDVPVDVQGSFIETEDLEGFDENAKTEKLAIRRYDGTVVREELLTKHENPVYDEKLTSQIIKKIKCAKRPVVFAGTGIRLSGAYDTFLELVDKLGIPVVTAWNAHDVLPDNHPLYAGRPGTVGTRGGNFVVQNSDLLLVLGCRLNIRQISYNYEEFATKAYKIVVDIDENELCKPTTKVDMPVHADVADVMKALVDYIDDNPKCLNRGADESSLDNQHDGNDSQTDNYLQEDGWESERKGWLQYAKEINAKYPAVLPEYYEKDIPMNPYAYMAEMSKAMEEGDKIICGNGSACVISFQALALKKDQRLFTNSGCAAMGYGFPAAIGACIAEGNKRTICIDGDGSFMMNLQELQTVRYHNMNLKIFILNNNGYHSIRQTQTNLFKGKPYVGICDGNGISFPQFEKIAYAFDIPYQRIENVNEAAEQVREVLAMEGPVLCEVVVDEAQNFAPKLASKALPDGTMVSPEIDDMYPFLEREEYENNKLS